MSDLKSDVLAVSRSHLDVKYVSVLDTLFFQGSPEVDPLPARLSRNDLVRACQSRYSLRSQLMEDTSAQVLHGSAFVDMDIELDPTISIGSAKEDVICRHRTGLVRS
jgi:hypothetical protein